MIKLEKVTKSNFHNLHNIISSWWDEKTCKEISEDISPMENKDWASFLRFWFIKNENNKYVGIIGLYQNKIRNNPKEIWLDWFCIQDIYRGKNYGKDALIKIIQKAKKNNFEVMRIESQPIRAKIANKLYQSVGFLREKYKQESKFSNNETYVFSLALKDGVNIKIGNKNFHFIEDYIYD